MAKSNSHLVSPKRDPGRDQVFCVVTDMLGGKGQKEVGKNKHPSHIWSSHDFRADLFIVQGPLINSCFTCQSSSMACGIRRLNLVMGCQPIHSQGSRKRRNSRNGPLSRSAMLLIRARYERKMNRGQNTFDASKKLEDTTVGGVGDGLEQRSAQCHTQLRAPPGFHLPFLAATTSPMQHALII